MSGEESANWTQRYATSLMNTFGAPKLVLDRGDGARVWDVDGNEYLDLLGGIAVNVLGHNHPAIVQALCEQAPKLIHTSNFFTTTPQVELAERLLGLVGAEGRVFFTNSGTEANEAAFKLTRRTGRTKVVAAHDGFHGRSMGALALTWKPAYREPFEPLPGDVEFVPYGDADALAAAIDDDTAAVVLESMQGEAGAIVPPDGYLAAARSATTKHGALLWVDEVQTGIGRTGDWFGYQSSGITPDVVTVAKGLGGGVPIGVCIALGSAGEMLQPGNHGTTFGGNPLATSVGLAVLDTIEKDGLREHASSLGERIRTGLTGLPHVTDVSGRGLLIGAGLDAEIAPAVHDAALAAGLIINACGPTRLRLAPPLVLTNDQADRAVAVLADVLAKAQP